jgi:hypothetical protein
LGSDRTDIKARDLLAQLAEFIDNQDALLRYKVILLILNKPALLEG